MRSNQRSSARLVRLTVAGMVMAACTTTTDLVPIQSITVLPQLDSVEVGQTYSGFLVTLKDAAGVTLTGRPLAWESSNVPVASIDASTGTLTGITEGNTVITVRSGGKEAQATIKVISPILSIVVTPDSFDLPLTTNRAIAVQLVGPNGLAITNRQIIWSSSSPGIAVVSAAGVVTAVSTGTTTITIRAGTKQASVRVRVVGEPVTSVRITPQQSLHPVRFGQTKQLTAECLNAQQQVLTGRPISWNSGSPTVATVTQSGLVTGVSLGAAQISATCDNTASGSTQVQVTPVPVTSASISPPGLSLVQGTQGQLIVTARDSANNVIPLQGRTVTWFSSNIPVAQVSAQGVVFGATIGTAEITVSVDNVTSAPVTVDVHAFFSLLTQSMMTVASTRVDSGVRRATGLDR